jgi:hypothetical protein
MLLHVITPNGFPQFIKLKQIRLWLGRDRGLHIGENGKNYYSNYYYYSNYRGARSGGFGPATYRSAGNPHGDPLPRSGGASAATSMALSL